MHIAGNDRFKMLTFSILLWPAYVRGSRCVKRLTLPWRGYESNAHTLSSLNQRSWGRGIERDRARVNAWHSKGVIIRGPRYTGNDEGLALDNIIYKKRLASPLVLNLFNGRESRIRKEFSGLGCLFTNNGKHEGDIKRINTDE
ncbi:hypothetical protein EVAR_60839_1 [Eumeta japonica]|uniref:Secreted protein n=1 Tax=Eumeta variegata TaxID=151549 RepID=A0A4C1Y8N8_EUMVA|nr:hypothetical protein EVAR_60839_1 [Eumeta japonica]